MDDLTKRQSMVAWFIMTHINEFGYPPTLREIGAHMGIRSTNGVNDHLRALERKGYIRIRGMKSRGIELIRHPTTGERVHVVVLTQQSLSVLAEARAQELIG